MKKVFGVIFLVVGLLMIAFGVAALTDVSSRSNTFGGRLRNEISYNYRAHNNQQQAIGLGLIGAGFVLFLGGIIMVATKSASQKRKEAGFQMNPQMQSYYSQMPQQNFSAGNFQPHGPQNVQPQSPPNGFARAQNSTVVPTAVQTMDEKFSQLEKLGKLKEQGLITEEEFQEQKRKVLG